MEPRTSCGCHEDYHELGVHRPGFEFSPAGPDDDQPMAGAA